jgi:hypothetical protein
MMVVCFEKHFQGQLCCVSLKAGSILETLKSFIGSLCSGNIIFFSFFKVGTTLLMLGIQMLMVFSTVSRSAVPFGWLDNTKSTT